MAEFVYDKDYYESMRGHDSADAASARLFERFLAMAGRASFAGKDVLDLGSGRGELLEMLAANGAKSAVGVDFSPAAVVLASARLSARSQARVLQASATDAALFPASSFDFVFMTDLVEHLSPVDLSKALHNARNWLRPEGRLIIHTFPTKGPHVIFQAVLFLLGRRQYLARLNQIHCNVQTRRSLLASIEGAGLRCVSLELADDVLESSSAYQSAKRGYVKWMFRFATGLLRTRFVTGICRLLGLEEFVRPSIYCVCVRNE